MKDDPTYLRRLRRQIDITDLMIVTAGILIGLSLCALAYPLFHP